MKLRGHTGMQNNKPDRLTMEDELDNALSEFLAADLAVNNLEVSLADAKFKAAEAKARGESTAFVEAAWQYLESRLSEATARRNIAMNALRAIHERRRAHTPG